MRLPGERCLIELASGRQDPVMPQEQAGNDDQLHHISELVRRAWEPEPLRWLGINAGLRAMSLADGEEARTGRESRLARLMSPFIGGH